VIVRLPPHAVEWGATEAEIIETDETGTLSPYRHGRTGLRRAVPDPWNRGNPRFHSKRLEVYAAPGGDGGPAITVIVSFRKRPRCG
jgi:hypothetical protein